jgi:hypothetical protein
MTMEGTVAPAPLPSRIAPVVSGPLAGARPIAAPPVAASSSPELAVQRAVAIEELSPEAGAGAGAGAGGTAGGAGGGNVSGAGLAAATDGDLDLLARRLYGRIRDRLRGELLLDRERSGSLADF